MQKNETTSWACFQDVNKRRRAIRDFDDVSIPEGDIKEILKEGMLAPSSANVQPFEIHWIRSKEQKAVVAKACNGQKAAATASDLIVIVASTKIAKQTISDLSSYVQETDALDERSKEYNRKIIKSMGNFLKYGPLILISPFLKLLSLFLPAASLIPFGPSGARQWAARNSIYAVQNIMLATVAKGYDSCPMEGFNAIKIAQLLKLPYGSVIPVVVAIGKAKNDARIEPQWRRKFTDAVVVH